MLFFGKLPREYAMRADTNPQANQTNKAEKSGPRPSARVWLGGVALRTLFLIVLTILTARVASPQMEHLTSVHETPGDLIRVLMGIGVCGWLVVNLFILPKDPGAYQTWIYLGIVLLPLSALCLIAVW